MSSGFISEAELAEQRRIRQEEWEKVRKPGQPEECPQEEYDHRSLFERLEEQKQKRELEYEEAHRLKNMIKGLDDDEVEFLDLVDRSKLEEERRKSAEEAREMKDFREAVATLQERSLEQRIHTEIRSRPPTHSGTSSGRSSQVRLLAGAVVRKRPADCSAQDASNKKPCTNIKEFDVYQVAMVEQLHQNDQAQAASVGGLVFEDDEHNTHTLQSLNKMRKNRHFCDVILHVGSMEFHAHRAVLACASPHLFELFTADDENKGSQRENIITYKLNGGFDRTALEKLIHYAYTARLEVPNSQVKAVYLAARHLKMDRVVKECLRHLIKNLNVENCIETRSLPGIAKNKTFVEQVDTYIAKEFENVSKSKILLSLPCVRIEVLNQTREEMSLVVGESVCQLVLEWIKRQCEDSAINMDQLTEKTHLLYLAMDNSLQDCTELPTGDMSDTEIVQDYKKLSKRNQGNSKGRRKSQLQPAKPRVLIYSRDIGARTEQEKEIDWNLIAAARVGEHAFMALVTINGQLATMSVMLRLNQPSSPSPVVTPVASRPASEEKPDLYCVMANMSSVKCAAGCANLNDSLLVCGGYDRAECLKCVELYDPETNLWGTLSSMKEARGRFDIAVVKGKVYAIGGSNGTTELATVEKYDPQVKKWTQITPLPLARCNIGVCDLNELIYCIGGWNGQVGIKQCDVLDPTTGQWSLIAPLQTGRYQAGVCAMDGLVFAAGGCAAWNCLSSVEVYDPQTDEWTYAKGMITARRGCGLAVFKGKLYAVGGSDGSHSLCSTEIYCPQEKIWTPGPNMTTARANVGVAVIGSRLYAVGGFSGKNFLNSIEYLDEKTNEWTTFVPKLPAQSGAESPQPDPSQANGFFLQSLDSQVEQGDGMVSHHSVGFFRTEKCVVEGTVLSHRKGSENNVDEGGSGSIMRFETSGECEAFEYP